MMMPAKPCPATDRAPGNWPMSQARAFARAVTLAFIFVLLTASCTPILSERAYTAVKIVSSDSFFDDFEDNDGSVSLAYYYGGRGKLSSEWAASGSWSISIPFNGTMSFVVNPTRSARVRYLTSPHCTVIPNVDGVQPQVSPNYCDDYYEYSFEIAAGRHTVELESLYSVVFIDDLSCAYDFGAAYPAENTLQFSDPQFSWPAIAGATAYELELSTNPDLSTLILDEKDLASPRYTLTSALADGEWYWRTRSKVSNYWGFWSPVRHFLKIRTALNADVPDASWSFSSEWNLPGALDLVGGPDGGYAINFPGTSSSSSQYGQLEGSFDAPRIVTYMRSGGSLQTTMDSINKSTGAWKSGTEGWYDEAIAVSSAGSHVFQFLPNDPKVKLASLRALPFVVPVDEGFEGGSLASSGYRLFGVDGAAISAATSHAGSSSLSLAAAAGGAAFLMPVRLEAPATLSFYARNTGPMEHSYLPVTVAGANLLTAYLGPDWAKYSVTLPAGYHALLFEYSRSYTGFNAWVDDIAFE